MPAALFSDALKEFEATLEDLSTSLEFVRTAGRLRPRLNGMLRWETLDGEAKTFATTFLRLRAEQTVLYRALVVSLAGAFEHYIRRLIRDSVSAINKAGRIYDRLDEGLRRQNLYRTGVAFQTIFEPLDYFELDYHALAKNLGTCYSGSSAPVLNADAFAMFLSALSPEKFLEAWKRLGIELNWDDFGRIRAVQEALDKGETRMTAKAAHDFLKKFSNIRNNVAHTGSTGVVVSDIELESFFKIFRSLAAALSTLVEAALAKHINSGLEDNPISALASE